MTDDRATDDRATDDGTIDLTADNQTPVELLHVECWRCGLSVGRQAAACPHCGARPRGTRVAANRSKSPDPVKVLFVSYSLLLATGLVHAFVFGVMFDDVGVVDAATRTSMLQEMLAIEVVDTVIMLVVLAMRIAPSARVTPGRGKQLAAWLAAAPILAALLTINWGYHWLLRNVAGLPLITDDLMSQIDALTLLVFCVQPAIVEEAYCRLFALNSLMSMTGVTAAVWLSATMFAFLHIAVLPSIPYLLLLGAVLAYLRLSSGTLILPIVIHFLHNLLVMLYLS
jgi:membrane protease YdiL (CAAX protease family)